MGLCVSTDFSQADKFFEQGNLVQALRCYQNLEQSIPEIKNKINQCFILLLRKYWRQGKVEDLQRYAIQFEVEAHLALPLARLKGTEALKTYSEAPHSTSTILAKCSTIPDLKKALLELRQESELKEIAEGWIVLMKGDAEKALTIFSQAAAKAPVQARIGEGIALLSLGRKKEANQCLAPLRSFAASRFPLLFKTMGWNGTEETDKDLLHHYLFHASLNELQELKKSQLPQHKKLKGWICLRIGDLLYGEPNMQHKAVIAWKEAAQVQGSLRGDMLKRLFLFSFSDQAKEPPGTSFAHLYGFLVNTSKDKAACFLQHLIDFFTPQPSLWLVPEDLRKKNKWAYASAPPSFKFFWFSLFCKTKLHFFKNIFVIPPLEATEKDLGEKWDFWVSLFEELDPHYLKNENYLECKFLVAKVYNQDNVIQKCLSELLLLNPLRKEEWLTYYIRALNLALLNNNLQNHSTRQQLKQLLTLFPHDFDLLRFSILLDSSDSSWMDQIQKHAAYLSEPFLAVLKLQLAIDNNCKISFCKTFFLDKSLYGRNQDADHRFIAALLEPSLKILKKDLENKIEEIARDDHSKHRLFSFIFQSTGKSIPLSILKKWKPYKANRWMVHYHTAFYHLEKMNIPKMCDAFYSSLSMLNPDQPEYHHVKYTLDVVDPTPKLNSFMQEFNRMIDSMDFDDFIDMFGEK